MNRMQAPPLTPVNKLIAITTAVCFLVHTLMVAVGVGPLTPWLGLSANGLMGGRVWQLMTYPFLEVQLISTIFSILLVWFIGSELEAKWGRRIYVRFLLATAGLTGLFYVLLGFISQGSSLAAAPLFGLTGIGFSLCVAYALMFPDREFLFMFVFPLKAKHFCWLMAGMELYMAIFSSGMQSAWAHLVAMGVAFVLIRWQTHALIRRFFLGGGSDPKPRTTRQASHLQLVKPEEEKDKPRYWH